jgi:hypothetical protein
MRLKRAPITDPAGIPSLQDAIRRLHGCESRHVGTVYVHEVAPSTGETVWKGDVEVFALTGNPQAARCYAWSEPTPGGKRRFFAALHVGKVDSAARAVQGSIIVDAKAARD